MSGIQQMLYSVLVKMFWMMRKFMVSSKPIRLTVRVSSDLLLLSYKHSIIIDRPAKYLEVQYKVQLEQRLSI